MINSKYTSVEFEVLQCLFTFLAIINMRRLYYKIQTHKSWLSQMEHSKYLNEDRDIYSQGVLVQLLEQRVAKLLGKEQALFFHKGITAQLVVLKMASESKKCSKVILHPSCHIAANEQGAYQALMGLRGIQLGEAREPFKAKDVLTVTEKASVLTVELPLRNAGFKLTAWCELVKMNQWAKQNDTHFHMDGARLWESSHFYQKPLAEIADLFDSVYVSFYKGLGGIGGAVLTGDADFIEKCKVWRSRMGGDLYTAFPQLITALNGLDTQLGKIHLWVERAQEIAKVLDTINQVTVKTPQTNGFLVYVEGDLDKLNSRIKPLNEKFDASLLYQFKPTECSHIQKAEMQVGPAADEIPTQEIVDYFQSLVSLTSKGL